MAAGPKTLIDCTSGTTTSVPLSTDELTDFAARLTAGDTLEAARLQAVQDAATVKSAVLTVAQSAVGVLLTDLTAAQVRALVACLLYKEGAFTPDMKVRPLAQWLR